MVLLKPRLQGRMLALLGALATACGVFAADPQSAASQASGVRNLPSASTPDKASSAPSPSSAGDAISVLEFSSVAPVSFSTSVPKFQRRLVLSIAPRKEKTLVTVTAGALEERDGTIVPVALTHAQANKVTSESGMPIELVPGQQSFEVRLTADLPRQGEYNGYLSLKLGDAAAQLRAIKVSFALTDIPVQVGSAYRVAAEHFYSPDGALAIQVSGPSDVKLTEVSATVRELQRMPSPSEKVAAAVSAVSFLAKGQKRVALVNGVPESMHLSLDNLSAGSYVGKVTLAAPGYKAREEAISFVVRSSWILAFVLVVIGAGISAGIQYYATSRQPRLVVRDAANRLTRQMDGLQDELVPDRDEASVLQRLRAKVDDLVEQSFQGSLPSGWLAQSQATMKIVEDKLEAYEDWIGARRTLAEVDLPAATRTALQKDLDDSQSAIEGDTELSAAQKATLDDLMKKIQAARSEVMQAPVVTLGQQIDKEDGAATSVAAKNSFAAARSAADAALKALATSDSAGYRAHFNDAGVAYSRGKGLELDSHIPTPPTAEWETVRGLLRQLLLATEARAADALYDRAYDTFLKAQATTATDDVNVLQGAGEPRLAGVLSGALEVAQRAQVSRRDFGFGLEQIRVLSDGRNRALDMLGSRPDLRMQAATNVPDRGAAVPVLPAMPAARQRIGRRRQASVAAAGAELRWYDYVITAVAVISAGLLGVVMVWVPDNDWGQVADLFAAVLWGLGLHTIGSSTFIGISAVKSKLTGPAVA